MKKHSPIPLCIPPGKTLTLVFAGVCRNAEKYTHPYRVTSRPHDLLLAYLPRPSRPTPTIRPSLSRKYLSKAHTAS